MSIKERSGHHSPFVCHCLQPTTCAILATMSDYFTDPNTNNLLSDIKQSVDKTTPTFEDDIKILADDFWKFKQLWEEVPGLFYNAINLFHPTVGWDQTLPDSWFYMEKEWSNTVCLFCSSSDIID